MLQTLVISGVVESSEVDVRAAFVDDDLSEFDLLDDCFGDGSREREFSETI